MAELDLQDINRAKINLETSRIAWYELLRFFAGGMVLFVGAELDLVEVGYQFAQDNNQQVERWLMQGKIGKVSDEQATAWLEAKADMWAVVISPWVLVQQAD